MSSLFNEQTTIVVAMYAYTLSSIEREKREKKDISTNIFRN